MLNGLFSGDQCTLGLVPHRFAKESFGGIAGQNILQAGCTAVAQPTASKHYKETVVEILVTVVYLSRILMPVYDSDTGMLFITGKVCFALKFKI